MTIASSAVSQTQKDDEKTTAPSDQAAIPNVAVKYQYQSRYPVADPEQTVLGRYIPDYNTTIEYLHKAFPRFSDYPERRIELMIWAGSEWVIVMPDTWDCIQVKPNMRICVRLSYLPKDADLKRERNISRLINLTAISSALVGFGFIIAGMLKHGLNIGTVSNVKVGL